MAETTRTSTDRNSGGDKTPRTGSDRRRPGGQGDQGEQYGGGSQTGKPGTTQGDRGGTSRLRGDE